MKPPVVFDSACLERLAQRTEYEAWLLEAVYRLVEDRLFYVWPDTVVYAINVKRPKFIESGGVNIELGDWRPGFLNAGAPLIFVATFKLLDMLIEWVLEVNDSPSTFQFQQKLKALENDLIFPPEIEERQWLKQRLISMYGGLAPLRGTIIHERHFTTQNGGLTVAGKKKGNIGPHVDISAEQLRTLALTVFGLIKYVQGTWRMDEFREKRIRRDLDFLEVFHGQPSLHQMEPRHQTVRVHTRHSNPFSVDLSAISADLANHQPNADHMFDLRILPMDNGAVVDAFLFPWTVLKSMQTSWSDGLDVESFRVPMPNDLNAEDYAP